MIETTGSGRGEMNQTRVRYRALALRALGVEAHLVRHPQEAVLTAIVSNLMGQVTLKPTCFDLDTAKAYESSQLSTSR